MLDFSVLEPYIPLLATAVWITLKFTFFSTIMGFFGGFILALITLSKNRVLSFLAKVYISVFRGTPLLVQLMLIYFATPQLTSYTISALEAGVLSFGLNSAAYISEALRGGILAVDKGQWEGAMSLGVPKHRFLLDIKCIAFSGKRKHYAAEGFQPCFRYRCCRYAALGGSDSG